MTREYWVNVYQWDSDTACESWEDRAAAVEDLMERFGDYGRCSINVGYQHTLYFKGDAVQVECLRGDAEELWDQQSAESNEWARGEELERQAYWASR